MYPPTSAPNSPLNASAVVSPEPRMAHKLGDAEECSYERKRYPLEHGCESLALKSRKGNRNGNAGWSEI